MQLGRLHTGMRTDHQKWDVAEAFVADLNRNRDKRIAAVANIDSRATRLTASSRGGESGAGSSGMELTKQIDSLREKLAVLKQQNTRLQERNLASSKEAKAMKEKARASKEKAVSTRAKYDVLKQKMRKQLKQARSRSAASVGGGVADGTADKDTAEWIEQRLLEEARIEIRSLEKREAEDGKLIALLKKQVEAQTIHIKQMVKDQLFAHTIIRQLQEQVQTMGGTLRTPTFFPRIKGAVGPVPGAAGMADVLANMEQLTADTKSKIDNIFTNR